jgi:hypothetical protein
MNCRPLTAAAAEMTHHHMGRHKGVLLCACGSGSPVVLLTVRQAQSSGVPAFVDRCCVC